MVLVYIAPECESKRDPYIKKHLNGLVSRIESNSHTWWEEFGHSQDGRDYYFRRAGKMGVVAKLKDVDSQLILCIFYATRVPDPRFDQLVRGDANPPTGLCTQDELRDWLEKRRSGGAVIEPRAELPDAYRGWLRPLISEILNVSTSLIELDISWNNVKK